MPVLTPWVSSSNLPRVLAGELEVVELGAPVVALGERLPGQVQEPGLLRAVVEPVRGTARSATRNRAQLYMGSFEMTSSILRQQRSIAGMTRGSPVASWYCVSALSRGNSGQTS